jgi:phytoene dehydrogenase-like protein
MESKGKINHSTSYDVLIIGGGLAGLTAGIHLQRVGHKVLILEKRAAAGGLCGTSMISGYEFLVGCNEFGVGIEKEMKAMGVPINFEKKTLKFFFEHDRYQLPPDLGTCLKLCGHPIDLFHFISAILKKSNSHRTLEDLVEENVSNQQLAEFIKMFAYPFATPPKDLYLSALKEEFSPEYGYEKDQCLTPVGGPQNLMNQMVSTFRSLGGELLLNTTCTSIERKDSLKIVCTAQDSYSAQFVITSEGRWDQYPSTLKPGLHASKILVAVKKTVNFPHNAHALVYMPPDVSKWMNKIDKGETVQEFGFHLLHSNIQDHSDHYTANIYFFLPRGLENPNQAQMNEVEEFILKKTELMLPGFRDAILYKQFVSPKKYLELYGLSSQVAPFMMPSGFQKPSCYDVERDIYFIGNTVYPPGEHSGGAMLSGIYAAQRINQVSNKGT